MTFDEAMEKAEELSLFEPAGVEGKDATGDSKIIYYYSKGFPHVWYTIDGRILFRPATILDALRNMDYLTWTTVTTDACYPFAYASEFEETYAKEAANSTGAQA